MGVVLALISMLVALLVLVYGFLFIRCTYRLVTDYSPALRVTVQLDDTRIERLVANKNK